MFPRPFRVIRDGEKAPALLAGFGIVGGKVTPGVKFRTGVADDDEILGDIGGPGDGVTTTPVGKGVDSPQYAAVVTVQCIQVTVQRADEQLVTRQRNPSVDHAATDFTHKLGIYVRVEMPQQFT